MIMFIQWTALIKFSFMERKVGQQASFILLKKKHLVTTADIKMALENTFD